MAVTAHDTLDALGGARHGDPFSILGPHRDGDALVIRTHQPHAERVDLVRRPAGSATPMARVHASGVFEATFEKTPDIFDYRLRVVYPGGHTVEVDDPY